MFTIVYFNECSTVRRLNIDGNVLRYAIHVTWPNGATTEDTEDKSDKYTLIPKQILFVCISKSRAFAVFADFSSSMIFCPIELDDSYCLANSICISNHALLMLLNVSQIDQILSLCITNKNSFCWKYFQENMCMCMVDMCMCLGPKYIPLLWDAECIYFPRIFKIFISNVWNAVTSRHRSIGNKTNAKTNVRFMYYWSKYKIGS